MHDTRSVTKSLWALAALKAEEEGRLSLDAPVGRWLTEWRGDGRGEMTLRQMLGMTAGLEPAATRIYREGRRDLGRVFLDAALAGPPGQGFRYGPSGYEAAWEALRRALAEGEESLEEWHARRLCVPAGAGAPWWRRDETGRPFASAGARTRPEDLLQTGVMLARGGKGRGRERVLSEAAVEAAFRGSLANPAYGLGFWLNWQAARPDAVAVFPEDLPWPGSCFRSEAAGEKRVAC